MVDTISISGPVTHFVHEWTAKSWISYKKKDGIEKVGRITLRDAPDWRLFWHPNQDKMRVELSVPKFLFNTNAVNYAPEKDVDFIVRVVAESFFDSRSAFCDRMDIGFNTYFSNNYEASKFIESFRRTRMKSARVSKYRHQNYEGAVFYASPASGYSVKIYNKGIETNDPSLNNCVRIEKMYRTKALSALGMQPTPYRGVHLDSFDGSLVLKNFWSVLNDWERRRSPVKVEGLRGSVGLLSVLENAGLLDEVEAEKIVSQSTMWRYRNIEMKKDAAIQDFSKLFVYPSGNLTKKMLNTYKMFRTFGLFKARDFFTSK